MFLFKNSQVDCIQFPGIEKFLLSLDMLFKREINRCEIVTAQVVIQPQV